MDVTDRASAEDAVKMSGLPVLVIGASFILIGLMALTRPQTAEAANSIAILLRTPWLFSGLALVVIAFLIRGGRAGWVPFAVGLSAIVLIGRIALMPTLFSLVPILALLLSISGLRGWAWLRSHRDCQESGTP